MTDSQNPLKKHFRQPAIHVKLPSNGQYWAEGAVNLPVTGEVPVFPMTTKDEITIRTPDALLNGSGVISVIQSCIPSIVDAWKMPSIDVDAALIAIRIASYSNIMDIETQCPHCKEENSYGVDLNNVLANISAPNYAQPLVVDGLTFKFKPQIFFEVNKANLISFEEQKLLNIISDVTLSDEDKLKGFASHLEALAHMNNQLFVDCTEYIETPDGVKVTSPEFLIEFYKDADRKIVSKVKDTINGFGEVAKVKPVSVVCADCGEPFNVNLTFDYSSFFA